MLNTAIKLLFVILLFSTCGYMTATLIMSAGCKKEECKSITEMIVNGYDNTITYPLKNVMMCGSELQEIRKQNNTFTDIHLGGSTYRITTFIIEK